MTDGDGAQRTATTTLNVIATTPPSPAFVATPNPVVAGQPVTFDASGSTDDGTIVRYEWDLDGNGSYETDGGASPLVTRSFPNATVMSIGVRATDDDGRTAVVRSPLVVDAPAGAGGGGTGGGSPGFDPGVPDGSGGAGIRRRRGVRRLRAVRAARAVRRRRERRRARRGPRRRVDPDAEARDQEGPGPALQRRSRRHVHGLGQPAGRDARRLGLSKSKTKPYVLGTATVKLKKAGAAVVTVRLARRALSRLKRTPRVTVVITGKAVDGGGGQVALRRAILIRR